MGRVISSARLEQLLLEDDFERTSIAPWTVATGAVTIVTTDAFKGSSCLESKPAAGINNQAEATLRLGLPIPSLLAVEMWLRFLDPTNTQAVRVELGYQNGITNYYVEFQLLFSTGIWSYINEVGTRLSTGINVLPSFDYTDIWHYIKYVVDLVKKEYVLFLCDDQTWVGKGLKFYPSAATTYRFLQLDPGNIINNSASVQPALHTDALKVITW